MRGRMAASEPGCICVDGAMFAPAMATVSALDAGLLLGDGLFESLRATDGRPYLLDRHLGRLCAAAEAMGFPEMPTPAALADLVEATLLRASLTDAYVRITVTRGRSVAALAPPTGPATVVIAALPAPPRREDAIDVALIRAPAELRASAKSTSRQTSVLARRSAGDVAEAIYVSARGNVLEGVSSNVFALRGGVLTTPAVEDCLPGITRGRVLELAREAGLRIAEQSMTVRQLLSAEEAFVTNAVQGLRAIGSIDGRSMTVGGPVFARLLGAYEADRVRVTVAGQPRYRASA